MYYTPVVKETTDKNTERCVRQLAAYGAVCLMDNNNQSPIDILMEKNRISDAETLFELTCNVAMNHLYYIMFFLLRKLTDFHV